MAHIKSRKHPPAQGATLAAGARAATVLTGLALTLPLHAQTAATATLPQVTVTGDSADDYKADKVASPKFTQPLVNTTQTVSVIKEQVLKEQGATTLTEALRNVPGVGTFNIGENGRMNTGDSVSMRGFDTSNSIFVDGVRDLGNITRDVFNTEQIEVFKGPAGSDNGRTAASGSINMVTKQPRLEDSFDASLGLGSARYKRTTVDWNKQLTGLPGAAFRLNLMGENSGVAGRDTVKNKKWGVAPSLALGLGTENRLYLDLLHVKQNNIPDGGVPTVGLKGYNAANITSSGTPVFSSAVSDYLNTHPVSSSAFYGTADDFQHVTADMATARFEHDFSADTTLRNTTRWGKSRHRYLATAVMAPTGGATDPAAVQLSR
ncbi:MAG: TonB-dependent receptor plug domain-containing protein, partial [Comamonas sp.]